MTTRELEAELERWRDAGHAPKLWWRDDDAVDVTDQLDRFTKLTGDNGVPVLLAVIPAHAKDALANHVALYRHLDPCVHGWAHQNHEPPEVKKTELGSARALEEVLADVARGHDRLEVLFGQHLQCVLVPPWNRMREDLAARLPDAKISMFSTFGHKLLNPEIQANTHVDLMNWAERAGKPVAQVMDELAHALKVSRANGAYEIGLLSHHLVHDEAAWNTMSALLALEGVEWVEFPGSTKCDDAGSTG